MRRDCWRKVSPGCLFNVGVLSYPCLDEMSRSLAARREMGMEELKLRDHPRAKLACSLDAGRACTMAKSSYPCRPGDLILRTASPTARFLPFLLAGFTTVCMAASTSEKPHLLQRPALSQTQIVVNYAGDLWSVDRKGGHATRLPVGVGIETSPVFSPDGSTIAFTGEYDGNTDVFTIPATGGVPHRVTYHPSADVAVGWSPDGKQVVFRSDRQANSRYTQLYEVPATGGFAKALPLPMAYDGQLSTDGGRIAYSPLGPSFSFDYNRYVAWGNYRGGRASTIWIAGLKDLDSVEIPHETASDLDPVWVGKMVHFLSDGNGPMTIYKYDPATKSVAECLKNAGKPDIHSLAAGPGGLVYDQLGGIYLYDPVNGQSH